MNCSGYKPVTSSFPLQWHNFPSLSHGGKLCAHCILCMISYMALLPGRYGWGRHRTGYHCLPCPGRSIIHTRNGSPSFLQPGSRHEQAGLPHQWHNGTLPPASTNAHTCLPRKSNGSMFGTGSRLHTHYRQVVAAEQN